MDPLSEPQTIKVEKEKEADSTTSSKTEKFLQQSKSVLENFQKVQHLEIVPDCIYRFSCTRYCCV